MVQKVYRCNICKEDYPTEELAEKCEEQHTCKHPDICYYFIKTRDACGGVYTIGIKATCIDCGKSFGDFEFDEIEPTPKLLKAIWELIATHQGIALPITPSDSKT